MASCSGANMVKESLKLQEQAAMDTFQLKCRIPHKTVQYAFRPASQNSQLQGDTQSGCRMSLIMNQSVKRLDIASFACRRSARSPCIKAYIFRNRQSCQRCAVCESHPPVYLEISVALLTPSQSVSGHPCSVNDCNLASSFYRVLLVHRLAASD